MSTNGLLITARFSCYLKAHEIDELDEDAKQRTYVYHFHHGCQSAAAILASRTGVAD